MELLYLDFDFSDEDSGRGSFDAMATVPPGRVPAVLAEMAAVLKWAVRGFGPPGELQDDSVWDLQLEGVAEHDESPMDLTYDDATGEVSLQPILGGQSLARLTLTLSGSPQFCEAFRDEFSVD